MKKLAFLLFPLLALTVGSLSASLSRAGLEGMYPLLINHRSPRRTPSFPSYGPCCMCSWDWGWRRSCERADRAHPAR